jgi:hypothetical protein
MLTSASRSIEEPPQPTMVGKPVEEEKHCDTTNTPTKSKLTYSVNKHSIISDSYLQFSLTIANYHKCDVAFQNLTITTTVTTFDNVKVFDCTILEVKLPSWNTYLHYSIEKNNIFFKCHDNTRLDFLGHEFSPSLPIMIEVTLDVPKLSKSHDLRVLINETASMLDPQSPLPGNPLRKYHGTLNGRHFHFSRDLMRQNLLGSSPQSFLRILLESMTNKQVKSLLMLQMKNHFQQALHKNCKLVIVSAYLDQFRQAVKKLKESRKHGKRLISEAIEHCKSKNAIMLTLLLKNIKHITIKVVLPILNQIDPENHYADEINKILQAEIESNIQISNIIVNDAVLKDYLENNLELIKKTPTIMMAWAIAKNATVRIWEYQEPQEDMNEYPIYIGQHHIAEKESQDLLHNVNTDEYQHLISQKNIDALLNTKLALRLHLFEPKPPVAIQVSPDENKDALTPTITPS